MTVTGVWTGQLGQQSTWGLWTVDLLVEAQALRRKTGQGALGPPPASGHGHL